MNNICTICLDNCRNKVCNTCNCYAHYRCWGKYLQNKTINYAAIVEDDIFMCTPVSIECPQCRQTIINLKPVTRSDTYAIRYLSFIINLNFCLDTIYIVEDKNDKKDMFKTAIKIIKYNKNLLSKDYAFKKIVKKEMDKINNKYNFKLHSYSFFLK